MLKEILDWMKANIKYLGADKFLAEVHVVCFETKYNECKINLKLPQGWNFDFAEINMGKMSLAEYNELRPFFRGFIERVELMSKLHQGQTNEQIKQLLKSEGK